MWNNAQAMKRVVGWLYLLIAIMLLTAGGIWLYHSPYFPIRKIDIQGEITQTNARTIEKIAQDNIHGNIFKADLDLAQKLFEQLPWIEKAEIRRRLPDTVEIKLIEHSVIARWGENALLDKNGKVFQAQFDGELPIFEGNTGAENEMIARFALFQQEFNQTHLKIKKLIFTQRSAWSVELNNGLVVYLGREHELERLKKLMLVWLPVIEPQLEQLEYIDMRYRDGFAVKPKKGSTTPPSQAANTEKIATPKPKSTKTAPTQAKRN